jgi:hypothetical protein
VLRGGELVITAKGVRLTIGGSLRTRGDGVVTFEVDAGATVSRVTVGGAIEALGTGSSRTSIEGTIPEP